MWAWWPPMTGDRQRDPAADAAQAVEPSSAAGGPGELLLEQAFDIDSLYALRSAVAVHSVQAGLSDGRTADLVAAAHELAANSIRHGGGHGRLRLWNQNGVLHCQVSDEGPASGPREPDPEAAARWGTEEGSGLWLVRRLADQMHLQTGPYGTIVTISLTLGPPDRLAEFRVDHHASGSYSVLTVSGELDLRSVAELNAAIGTALDAAAKPPRLILDLSRVTFWDSSGIAALITAQQSVDSLGDGRLVLAGLSEPLRLRLRTMGVYDRFDLTDSTELAVKDLTGPDP